MAIFTVTVDDAALAVQMRTREDVTADAYVQGMVDGIFAASFDTAQREAREAREAQYQAANDATKAEINAALATVPAVLSVTAEIVR